MWTLIVGVILFIIIIRQDILNKQEIKEIQDRYKADVDFERKQAIKQSKAVIKGQVTEHILPMFKDFPYKMSECRFAGAPIDYIIFENMDQIREGSTEAKVNIIFADVKVNKSANSPVQNAIKDAVKNNRVRFEQWKVSESNELKIKI